MGEHIMTVLSIRRERNAIVDIANLVNNGLQLKNQRQRGSFIIFRYKFHNGDKDTQKNLYLQNTYYGKCYLL